MDVKYLKQVALGFVCVLLVLLIFGYVVYHVTGGFATEIRTTPALRGEYLEKEEALGYIFREESVVSSSYSGTVDYSVSNGEKIYAGATVAKVYETSGDALSSEMVSIDKKIALLRDSNIEDNVIVSSTKSTDEAIEKYLSGMFKNRRDGNYAAATSVSDDLLIALNRRELIVSRRTSYDDLIEELSERRAQIASSLFGKSESVSVEKSGYFYYDCDGYEGVFLPELLDAMTPSGLEALVSSEPDVSKYIGKNVTNQNWRLAVKLDRADVGRYETGETYKISFDDYDEIFIDMKLDRVAYEADVALLVFSSNVMPQGFDFEREQSISIITGEYEGLRFPMSAIRINDGVEGVFVLYGNTVFFRAAEVIGSENGYAVVKIKDIESKEETDESEAVWENVALYDEVIISGIGLYHTMIVN